ncbi:lipoate--protein ligase family protein [Vagococcus vulneris]|uniref:BPL/LPL catalytic domain-containing protein n=1 Tax=Vagococcus vulneris TaxID=1977869 RepID=A0A429ZXZ0_9ENTE|nr:lipoate--protein ligase family protein [Vagococcus vulneris]RST98769.1 hypothetical protein CBF37_06900 [Vagococcus vulneris]
MNLKGNIFNQGCLSQKERFDPFIYTDLLTAFAGRTKQIIFHFWQMSDCLILGMKDTRLPHLQAGLATVYNANYYPVVRNSGGLAVVADDGVLNFSLIIPEYFEQQEQSIDDGYTLMKKIIDTAFADFNHQIDAHEVSDSYCPGDFDLSIEGQKFAGIAQRRVKQGISVMIYLSVTGNQQYRGELVRQLYLNGLTEKFGTDGYPPVRPESMANLEDLLQTNLTISDVIYRLEKAISTIFPKIILDSPELFTFLKSQDWQEQYTKQQQRMTQRNSILTAGQEEES